MNPRRLKKILSIWQALLDLLVVSATLGLFMYWRKQQQQPRTQRGMEIPVTVAPFYPPEVHEPVVNEPEVEAPGSVVAPTTAADDLQRIEGIGPKIERVLNAAGVTTFQQLAERDVEEIRQILAAAEVRANTSTWAEQAQLASSGKWEQLFQLQSKIKGGRRID
jgi:predicted flap endonuclease-1-like 5' DNA nuclease